MQTMQWLMLDWHYYGVSCPKDTHNKHRSLELPEGDVLVHAGDFTTLGQLPQVDDFMQWFSAQPHPHKILIAGNHDISLDVDDYSGYLYEKFHPQMHLEDPDAYAQRCLELVRSAPGVTYLCNSSVTIDGITVYGSPWTQPSTPKKHMAFQKADLHDTWNLIPEGTDVVITHGPPLFVGDLTVRDQHIGNPDLLYHLEDRVQPRVHIFGHNHEGYGVTTSSLGGLTYINASTMTRDHRPLNRPVVFELQATPDGEEPQPARILDFGAAPRLPRSVHARGVHHQRRHLRAGLGKGVDATTAAADPDTKYSTAAVVMLTGRAIAIDLAEALRGSAICEVRHPHMTLLFRSTGFSPDEAVEVQEFINEYIKASQTTEQTSESATPLVEFSFERWGKESDLVRGPLAELAKAVFDRFEEWHQGGTYRPPHVQLRRKQQQQQRTNTKYRN